MPCEKVVSASAIRECSGPVEARIAGNLPASKAMKIVSTPRKMMSESTPSVPVSTLVARLNTLPKSSELVTSSICCWLMPSDFSQSPKFVVTSLSCGVYSVTSCASLATETTRARIITITIRYTVRMVTSADSQAGTPLRSSQVRIGYTVIIRTSARIVGARNPEIARIPPAVIVAAASPIRMMRVRGKGARPVVAGVLTSPSAASWRRRSPARPRSPRSPARPRSRRGSRPRRGCRSVRP